MGVKLASLLKGKQVTSDDLQGKRFSIDASHTLMQFLKKRYANSFEIATDHTQRVIPHLYGVFYRTIRFIENQILPVYCFDGKSSKMKYRQFKTDLAEFNRVKKMHKNMMEKGFFDKAKNIALNNKFLWKNTIRETRKLLTSMGIPFLNSPTEGEAQCAQLVKMGVCDYVISSDFDVLLYGAPLLRIDHMKGKKIFGTLYTLEEISKNHGIDRFQLIDLSILLGNDYYKGVNGIGPKKGVALIKAFGKLENMPLKVRNAIKLSHKQIADIRSIFLLPSVLTKIPDITLEYPNRGGIVNLMSVDHSLNIDRVNKGVGRLKRAFEKTRKEKRKRLVTSWFE